METVEWGRRCVRKREIVEKAQFIRFYLHFGLLVLPAIRGGPIVDENFISDSCVPGTVG